MEGLLGRPVFSLKTGAYGIEAVKASFLINHVLIDEVLVTFCHLSVLCSAGQCEITFWIVLIGALNGFCPMLAVAAALATCRSLTCRR